MGKKLTPFDMEYYATPISEADKKTLAEEGWRELTKQEVDDFMRCRKVSPSGVRENSQLYSSLQNGEMSLRFYKKDGVCVYVKKAGMCLPLGEGLTLEDLSQLKEP